MTAADGVAARSGARSEAGALLRWTPQLVALLVVAAALWAWSLSDVLGGGTNDMAGMGGMAGTMGMRLGAFAGMWALMMAAMMLPSVAPFATLYARTFQRRRTARLVAFTTTYLAAWGLTAVPAWLALRAVETVAVSTRSAVAVASVVYLTVGAWQLSPLKQLCLRHCRSPFGLLVHYGSFGGRLRDVRVAAHHAAYCLGCCWGLMTLFIVTGAMHVAAMVALTVLVAAEKLTPWGRGLTRATGAAALLAAVAVWWAPALAPGLA